MLVYIMQGSAYGVRVVACDHRRTNPTTAKCLLTTHILMHTAAHELAPYRARAGRYVKSTRMYTRDITDLNNAHHTWTDQIWYVAS